MIKNILYVGIGGFFGSSLRYIISKYLNTNLPLGTLLVNSLGSFLLGFFSYKIIKSTDIPEPLILMFASGFIGAFTTFSTYIFQSYTLFYHDRFLLGLLNVFANLFLGFAMVSIGFQLSKSF